MPAVFISHSSHDNKVANDLKAWLTTLGFERVFLDFDKDTGFGAGDDWEKHLYAEIARCHAVILILTPNWLASKWCFAELVQARALGKVILPVICAPLGEHKVLPQIQSVDLIDWNAGNLVHIEQRLHAITDQLARGFTLPANRSPYPGIHSFEAEDAAIFFGRDEETRAVIEKLDARRIQGGIKLLLIIGASGSGKSSLLKAGVLPQLSRQQRHWIPLPPLRPQRTPLEALAKVIAQHTGTDAWEDWYGKLKGQETIEEIAKLARNLRIGDASAAFLLLPIDQFEEVFTIGETSERVGFLALLATVLDPARGLPVMAVATGRADLLQDLLEGSALAAMTETTSLLPVSLDRVSLLVTGPATVASLGVEPGLAEIIKRDVESPEALPLLAQTLALLYARCVEDKRLTIANYLTLGDAGHRLNPVQNSVRFAADQAITGLYPKPNGQELSALRDAFVSYLIHLRLDDNKRVRQPTRRMDLPPESRRLLDALIDARLLAVRSEAPQRNGGLAGAVIEVAHEALFEAWPTLKGWLDEEEGFLVDMARLRGAYEIWQSAPERDKPQALLQGLLLNRACDWLTKYSRRFGSSTAPLHAFILLSRKAAWRRRRRILASAGLLALSIFAGLIAWVEHDALKELWRWYTVKRPYMQAQARYVLAANQERALRPKDSFWECAADQGKHYCPEMIVIPAGSFVMGSPPTENGREEHEGPQHQVTIAKPFAVSKFEVTFDEWDACVTYGDCTQGISDSGFKRGNQPVINLTLDDAQLYVAWLSEMTGKTYRLLTEAEYEYAARAGTQTAYPWGKELGKGNANCTGCLSQWDFRQTSPVGSFAPNNFGLYDMVGNVFEWVEDCYWPNYDGAPADGSARKSGDCSRRVVRGGSWNYSHENVRSAARGRSSISSRASFIGFRVGRTIAQ